MGKKLDWDMRQILRTSLSSLIVSAVVCAAYFAKTKLIAGPCTISTCDANVKLSSANAPMFLGSQLSLERCEQLCADLKVRALNSYMHSVVSPQYSIQTAVSS